MALSDLGSKLAKAMAALTASDASADASAKLISALVLALLQADVDVQVVKQLRTRMCALAESAPQPLRKQALHKAVSAELQALLGSARAPYAPVRGACNVVLLVGLQGAGKTTTCVKLAYYYKRKGWKTCLVCADTFRAGAFDQLKQGATKARIPFYGSYTEQDPAVVAAAGCDQFRKERYEMIIVDSSGRHRQQAALFAEMRAVVAAVRPDDVVFVVDASIGQAARAQAEAFRDAAHVGSVIITKLDGHARGGGALSAVAATGAPVAFVCTGEHVGDIEPFAAAGFVSRLLGRGDVAGLVQLVQEHSPQTRLDGSFSLRHMREQLHTLLSLGSLDRVLSMVPGIGALMGALAGGEKDVAVRRFAIIMDSMTAGELDSPARLDASRVRRLAHGAGVQQQDVLALLHMFAVFKRMLGRVVRA